ncbi:MAG: ketoacyl-ACP synthase III [Myxococcota bacterium]
MRHATLVSTGFYVPEIEIPNATLRERWKDSHPEFIDRVEGKSGIARRFYAPDDWATSDLAARAGEMAIERAGLEPKDIDLVVVGTDSPDYITPATSTVVQHKLGTKNAGTFDVGCACASFPTATSVAAGLIATNPTINHALVIGAYMMHKLADPADPMMFFYGDGAGAAVLRPSEEPGVLNVTFRADGAHAESWAILAGGTAEPINKAAIDAGRHQVRMYEKYPPEVNEEGWPAIVHKLCEDGGFRTSDVDCYIFTQVRKRQIEKVMARIEEPLEKAHMIMDRFGYTGSACIPMALHDALEAGKIKPHDLIVLVGSGVGYNQAGLALRASEALVASGRAAI